MQKQKGIDDTPRAAWQEFVLHCNQEDAQEIQRHREHLQFPVYKQQQKYKIIAMSTL